MTAKTELALMLCAAVLAGVILKIGFSGTRNFEEAALGTLTVGYEARGTNGMAIHTVKQKPEEIQEMLSSIQPEQRTVFILGNSQSHSINQWESGEINYPEMLSRKATTANILCNSLPNANLQEFYLIAAWWSTQIQIDQLIIPVFMDDLREDGLRTDFIPAILEEGFRLPTTPSIAAKINEELDALSKPAESAVGGLAQKKPTPQDIVEEQLNEALSDRSEIWRNRPNARGDFFMKLYQWRNTLFGINASTKRKMIPTRYDANMQALDALLELCVTNNIKALLYIPPIRTDVEVPYDLKEYAEFKQQIERMAAAKSSSFLNLENIVPGPLWGLKGSTTADGEPELDFMHFQAAGHELLADALAPFTIDLP